MEKVPTIIDQTEQLTDLIESNEYLVDFEVNDVLSFFRDIFYDLQQQFKEETYFFYCSNNTFESTLENCFGLDKHEEFFNEDYDTFIELIADYYQEVFDEHIYVFQSGYAEGIVIYDGKYYDSLSQEERDMIE